MEPRQLDRSYRRIFLYGFSVMACAGLLTLLSPSPSPSSPAPRPLCIFFESAANSRADECAGAVANYMLSAVTTSKYLCVQLHRETSVDDTDAFLRGYLDVVPATAQHRYEAPQHTFQFEFVDLVDQTYVDEVRDYAADSGFVTSVRRSKCDPPAPDATEPTNLVTYVTLVPVVTTVVPVVTNGS